MSDIHLSSVMWGACQTDYLALIYQRRSSSKPFVVRHGVPDALNVGGTEFGLTLRYAIGPCGLKQVGYKELYTV